MVVLLLNMGQLMRTDWNTFSLIRNDGLAFSLSLYNYITIFIAAGICLAAALVFRHYCRDYVKQLYHRQKLAKMVLENKWYEAEQVQSDGFFKDLSSSRSKEKISYFPKIYYQLKNGANSYSGGNNAGKISRPAFALGKETGKRFVL